MGWISGLIEILQVTSDTGCRSIVIISLVAGCTLIGNNSMCTGKLIKIIVIGKRGWVPIGLGGVTGNTIC